MSRKMLPREWVAILGILMAIAGQMLSPEVVKAIIDTLSEYAAQGVSAGGLLGALGGVLRIIYVGKKEGGSAANTDNPAAG